MIKLSRKLFSQYSLLGRILFFIFIFGILSFGRIFSIIHIEVHSFPIFVTEIVLFISLPLIITNIRELLKIPPLFLNIVFVYFLFGCFYLLGGVLDRNLFSVRDFVFLCGYMLFLPLALVCFKSLKAMKLFLFIIVFANFIAILVGRILIFGAHSSWFYAFISEAKTFQIGMVYGISSAFLLSSYNYLKNKAFRLLILVLVPINLYMIITFGVRSLWVAVICLAVFLVLILGFRIMAKIYLKLLVSFVLISTVLFYIDFEVFKSPQLNVFIGRGRSFVCAFARLSSKFTLPNEYDEATLKKELKRNDKPAFSNVQNKLEIGGESGRAGKPLSLNKPDKSVLGKDSERIGYDNIVWRKKVWKQTIEFTSGSYLFGKGFGHYPAYNIRGYQKPRSAFTDSNIIPTHNFCLTVFYKMGFVGLVLFLFINIYVFYYALRYLKQCKTEFIKLILKGSLGSLFFLYIMALFFDVIDSPPTSIFLWILCGLIFGAVEADKNLMKNVEKPLR